jgi:2-haloalkanoic acid dehalogenase type II
MSFDPKRVAAITFDCYGTLIDWEAGIRAYVGPLLDRKMPSRKDQPEPRPAVSLEDWLVRWERFQFALLTPYRPYREVLEASFVQTMRHFQLEAFVDEAAGLVRSLPEWRPFPDTVPALRRLARGRRLGIVSNFDRDLLAGTLAQLSAPLSLLVTAEDAQAYKPDPAPLRLALERLGLAAEKVLHAGFGWRYDLQPAQALGMQTAFVNRSGTEKPDGAPPDLEVPSLAALADALL